MNRIEFETHLLSNEEIQKSLPSLRGQSIYSLLPEDRSFLPKKLLDELDEVSADGKVKYALLVYELTMEGLPKKVVARVLRIEEDDVRRNVDLVEGGFMDIFISFESRLTSKKIWGVKSRTHPELMAVVVERLRDLDMGDSRIGEIIGKSRSAVANYSMKLLSQGKVERNHRTPVQTRKLDDQILDIFNSGICKVQDISVILRVHPGTIEKRLAEIRKRGELPQVRMTYEECRALDKKVGLLRRKKGNIGPVNVARLLGIPERQARSSIDRVTGARRRREQKYKNGKLIA